MKRDISKIMIANIIYLIVSVISNFILPKFLTIAAYANLKTYTFYISYGTLLSLGYCDGMYIRYGGKDLKDISPNDLSKNYMNYLILEVVICISIIVVSFIVSRKMLFYFALGMLFGNIIGYYRTLYQAIGEYTLYGTALNLQYTLVFLTDLALIAIGFRDNSDYFINGRTLVYLFVALFLTLYLNRRMKILQRKKFDITEIKINLSIGILLMLGNFANNLFTSVDRWYIKFFFENKIFAIYSFAVSVDNMMNVFLSPIYVTLYKTFCNNQRPDYILRIKQYTLLWGSLILVCVFPVKFVIQHFLPEYESAISILTFLFTTQLFYAVIKGVYVNYYKATHHQKKYFLQTISMTIISILLDAIAYCLFKSALAIAFATLITAIIWFAVCEFDEKKIRFSVLEYIYVIIMTISLIMLNHFLNPYVGTLIYISIMILCTAITMPARFSEICRSFKHFLKIRNG